MKPKVGSWKRYKIKQNPLVVWTKKKREEKRRLTLLKSETKVGTPISTDSQKK